MKNLISTLLFVFAVVKINYAQEHSGSLSADRNPYIAMYTRDDGSELLVCTSQSSAMGYYKKDGKLDSIKMGSFTKDDVGLYLKGGNQFDGTFKTEESFDVKVLNSDFKKIGKIKFTRKEFKSLDINAQIKDQEKFTQESGIATFNLGDGSELLFALWWEFRATLNNPTDANFNEIQGIAKRTKTEGGFDY